jgi:hypothetical protein
MYLEVADVERVVWMEMVHLNEPNIGHFAYASVSIVVGGIIPLHIGNHENGVGRLCRVNHLAYTLVFQLARACQL